MLGYRRRAGQVAVLLLLLGWIGGVGYADGCDRGRGHSATDKNIPEAAERFGDVHWYAAFDEFDAKAPRD